MSVHRPRRRRFAAAAFVASLLLLLVLWSSNAAQQVAKWRMTAESTEYRPTGSYDETIEYLRRLAGVAVLVLSATVAALIPARRAAAMDPARALRIE